MSNSTVEEEPQKYKEDLMRLVEDLCGEMINDKPEGKDVALYMIDWLKKKGGFSTSGLTNEEKTELEKLRGEIDFYRQMDYHQFYLDQLKNEKKPLDDNKDKKKSEKPKLKIPPEEKIVSDDEDNTSDDIDNELDNEETIKSRVAQKQRGAICDEVIGKYNVFEDFKYKHNKKSPEIYNLMRIQLGKSPLFSELDPKTFEEVVNSMEEKTINAATVVCRQGDWADNFYYILDGELECKIQFTVMKKDAMGKTKYDKMEPRLVKIFSKGDYFGEMCMLYHAKWRGTVMAMTEVHCYTLNKKTYKKIISDINEIRYNQDLESLKKVQILRTLDDKEKEKLINSLKTGVYMKEDKLVVEDEPGDIVYIIEEGYVVGTKTMEIGQQPEKVNEYWKGDVLGEKCLLKGQVWDENLVAKSDVVVVKCLDRQSFRQNIGNLEEILIKNPEVYNEYFPPEPEKEKKTEKLSEDIKEVKPIEKPVEVFDPEAHKKKVEEEYMRKYEDDKKRMEERMKFDLEQQKKKFEEETKKKYEDMLKKMREQDKKPEMPLVKDILDGKKEFDEKKNEVVQEKKGPSNETPQNVPGMEFINNYNNPQEEEKKDEVPDFLKGEGDIQENVENNEQVEEQNEAQPFNNEDNEEGHVVFAEMAEEDDQLKFN